MENQAQQTQNSYEHILPDSIGGTLQVKLLCTSCNNSIGAQTVSAIKSDPSIRLAIKSLRTILPDLFNKIENSQPYVGTHLSGEKIELSYKSGYLKTRTKRIAPNSIVHESKTAIKHLKKYLIKYGHTEDDVEKRIDEVRKLPLDNPLWLNSKTLVIKKSLKSVNIDFVSDIDMFTKYISSDTFSRQNLFSNASSTPFAGSMVVSNTS